jgi:hypothetical protein
MIMKHFLNCHVKGVHSLSVGTTEEGKLIRMFVAETHHTLWQNSMTNFRKGVQSLAFHNHKSDITIIPLTGIVSNISFQPKNNHEDSFVFSEFIYHSAIVDSDAGYFSKTGSAFVIGVQRQRLVQPLFLKANILHTVHVPKNTTASWLVIESDDAESDANHLSYSVSDLSRWSLDGLYQLPTDQQVKDLKSKYLLGANHGKS